MKPQRMIRHRDQSAFATCAQRIHGHRCGMPLILTVTKSPIRAYDEIVVIRCVWHITSGDGVLTEAPEEIEGYGV